MDLASIIWGWISFSPLALLWTSILLSSVSFLLLQSSFRKKEKDIDRIRYRFRIQIHVLYFVLYHTSTVCTYKGEIRPTYSSSRISFVLFDDVEQRGEEVDIGCIKFNRDRKRQV